MMLAAPCGFPVQREQRRQRLAGRALAPARSREARPVSARQPERASPRLERLRGRDRRRPSGRRCAVRRARHWRRRRGAGRRRPQRHRYARPRMAPRVRMLVALWLKPLRSMRIALRPEPLRSMRIALRPEPLRSTRIALRSEPLPHFLPALRLKPLPRLPTVLRMKASSKQLRLPARLPSQSRTRRATQWRALIAPPMTSANALVAAQMPLVLELIAPPSMQMRASIPIPAV
jgi:hypothetical protein